MAHDIFISYSHKDKAIADAICSHMENKGLRCWYAPRDIAPGADWASSIIDSIGKTKVLVLVFTENSNISQQVLREISNAVSAGIPIVPFKLTNDEPVAGMKYYLSTVHWLDALDGELESSIADLYDLCKVLVDNAGKKAKGEAGVTVSQDEIHDKLAESHAIREREKAAAKKKKNIAIAGIAAVAIIALLLIVLPKAMSSGNNNSGDSEGIGGEEGTSSQNLLVSDGISTDVTETYTQGNSQAVLQSDGYIATDGERYYYRSNDGQCMFSVKPDGTELTQLTFEPASGISVLDGYIYYYTSSTDPTIKRMKTDGTDMSILHQGMVEDLRIVNGRVYYRDSQDSLHLYSMSLEGKDVKLENDIEKAYSFCLDEGHMYYSNQEDGGKLYRVNMDGTEPVCLVENQIEQMTIAGNYLYYNDLGTNKFCSYDLTTGEVAELADDYIAYINVTEDGIYGYSGTYDTHLCYLQLNGLGFRVLLEEPVRKVSVCGDRIMYQNKDDSKLYMVDLEGQNKTEV